MKWQRLLRAKNDGAGGEASREISTRRVYGVDGNPYPRIVLAIYRFQPNTMYNFDDTDVAIGIEVARKESSSEWWEKAAIPPELLSELVDMIDQELDALRRSKP